MKKLLLTAAMMISAMAAMAQVEVGHFAVRPMVGITLSDFGVKEELSGYYTKESKYKVGFAIGAEVGYQVCNWFQPSVGIMYNQQGSKIEYTSILSDNKCTDKLDYISVPILANFYVAKGLALKIGVQPDILINAKEEGTDIKDYTNSFGVHIPVGISYEYQNFVIDARANIPCGKAFDTDKIAKEIGGLDDYVIKEARNNYFQITLGYNFEF